MNTKIAIYTRVSTDKQSHDSQLTELDEYCERRGWTNTTAFSDVISGAKFTRAGLDEMMKLVRRGKLDTIVCFKLDRLGRSLAHLAQIVGELTSNNVSLICTSQGIDTSDDNPAGRLQLGVLMAVAEFERSIIQERVNAGLKAAKARGVRLGRKPTLDKHRDAVTRLIGEGKGTREIARELDLPVSSTAKLVKGLKETNDRVEAAA